MIYRFMLVLSVCAALVGCQTPSTSGVESRADSAPALVSSSETSSTDGATGQTGGGHESGTNGGADFAPGAEAAIETAGELEWQADWATAQRLAGARGRPIMVDFYTDWCYWCKRLDSDTYPNREVAKLSQRQVSLKLNAEREGRELARKHGVRSYPTILYFDAQGKEIGRIAGYLPAREFLAAVKPILERFERR